MRRSWVHCLGLAVALAIALPAGARLPADSAYPAIVTVPTSAPSPFLQLWWSAPEDAPDPFISALATQDDPDPGVRLRALDAWARNPDQSLDPVTHALVDPDPSVRARAQQLFEQASPRVPNSSRRTCRSRLGEGRGLTHTGGSS